MNNCAIHKWMLLEILKGLLHLKCNPQIKKELDIFLQKETWSRKKYRKLSLYIQTKRYMKQKCRKFISQLFLVFLSFPT